ncbi:MAG: hypothetical protein OEO79_10995 [Gemmatimonadota bacterium]|nr:hypothetical protein [Gemmatimonadota bacterium]
MPGTSDLNQPTRAFWVISGVALLWNLVGVMTYFMSVTISPEALAAMSDAERSLYSGIPAWVTSAYAIAVFGGSAASLALVLRKAWAVPVFVVSLVGILVQMGHGFFMTDMLEVRGVAGAILPLMIVVVALYLVWFSLSSKKKRWIG